MDGSSVTDENVVQQGTHWATGQSWPLPRAVRWRRKRRAPRPRRVGRGTCAAQVRRCGAGAHGPALSYAPAGVGVPAPPQQSVDAGAAAGFFRSTPEDAGAPRRLRPSTHDPQGQTAGRGTEDATRPLCLAGHVTLPSGLARAGLPVLLGTEGAKPAVSRGPVASAFRDVSQWPPRHPLRGQRLAAPAPRPAVWRAGPLHSSAGPGRPLSGFASEVLNNKMSQIQWTT